MENWIPEYDFDISLLEIRSTVVKAYYLLKDYKGGFID